MLLLLYVNHQVYRNLVETHRDIDIIKFDDFEAYTLTFVYEHVFRSSDERKHILVAVDVTDVFDRALMIAVDQYACPICKGPLACCRFRVCPALAVFIKDGTGKHNSPRARWTRSEIRVRRTIRRQTHLQGFILLLPGLVRASQLSTTTFDMPLLVHPLLFHQPGHGIA